MKLSMPLLSKIAQIIHKICFNMKINHLLRDSSQQNSGKEAEG